MRNMFTVRILAAVLGAAISLGAVAADKKSVTSPSAKPETSPKGETVEYDDLRLHVGQKVIVHTKFHSTRSGLLMKFSQVELTLSIETPDGTSELTIPKETVDSVLVLVQPETAK